MPPRPEARTAQLVAPRYGASSDAALSGTVLVCGLLVAIGRRLRWAYCWPCSDGTQRSSAGAPRTCAACSLHMAQRAKREGEGGRPYKQHLRSTLFLRGAMAWPLICFPATDRESSFPCSPSACCPYSKGNLPSYLHSIGRNSGRARISVLPEFRPTR